MLVNHQDIDKKVRESFGSWEVPPPPGIWARLEQSVVDNRRSAMILLRRRIISVAAVILAFLTGYFIALNRHYDYPDTSAGNKTELASNQHQSATTDGGPGQLTYTESRSSLTSPLEIENVEKSRFQATMGKTNASDVDLLSVSYPDQFTNADLYFSSDPASYDPIDVTIPESAVWPGFVSKHRFDNIPVVADITDSIVTDPIGADPQFRRWSITGMAGQTYANYYQTSYAQQEYGIYEHNLISTTKDQIIKPLTSYSLDVDYRITNRIAIGTGLSMYDFSTPMTSPERAEFTLLSTDRTVGNSLGTLELNKDVKSYLMKVPLLEVNSTQFEQRLSYIEIPLTANFNIMDNRLGLGVRAGFGGNILLDNSVYLKTEDYSNEIGTTSEINDFYLSSIIAVDLSFRLHQNWKWNFSPVYRHALQPVSSSDYDPRIISFGLYTGILYRF